MLMESRCTKRVFLRLPKDFWPFREQERVTVEAHLPVCLSLAGTKRFCGRDRKVAICDFKFSSQLTL